MTAGDVPAIGEAPELTGAPGPAVSPGGVAGAGQPERPDAGMSGGDVALIVAAVLLASCGQLLLRTGMYRARGPSGLGVSLLRTALTSPWVVGGFTLFALSSLLWISALARVPLSRAYPFTALTYVVILAVSSFSAHEHVTPLRWVGAAVVVGGLFLVVRS